MDALVSWLWQGLALTASVAALLRTARPLSAATRYALWWATLAAVLALPFAPALAGRAGSARALPAAGPAASLVEPLVPLALPAPADWLVAVALGVWLGFLLLGGFSLWRAAAHLSALRRGARPMPAAREARLPLWRAVRGSGRPVTLAVSDEVAAPAALGLGPATVVLPRGLVERLDDDEVDQIVLHEYGHLRRWDDWARLAQAVLQAVVWFHPAVWWIDRRLELEREAACDDFVVRQTGAARRYAACLARAAELVGSPAHAGSLAPGMAASRNLLLARVGRLLDGRVRRHGLGLAAASLIAGLGALVAGVSTLAQSRPLVAVAAPVALVLPAVSPAARAWDGSARIGPLEAPVNEVEIRRTTSVAAAAAETPRAVTPALGAAGGFDLPGAVVPPPAYAEPPAPALDAAPLLTAIQPVAAPESWPAADRVAMPIDHDDAGPWVTLADAGASVGSGIRKASVATAGFFTRVGRSIASSF